MSSNFNTLIVGLSGMSASLLTPKIVNVIPTEEPNIINIVIQIVVGIATLWKLFKKNKN